MCIYVFIYCSKTLNRNCMYLLSFELFYSIIIIIIIIIIF